MFDQSRKTHMPAPEEALPGRDRALITARQHAVLGTSLQPPFPPGTARALFGLGCFWGAERRFWQIPGVFTTAVGYSGGLTPNPTYEEVCSGLTGHNEVVLVVYEPQRLPYERLLATFWEAHNPTQGMRQGNDVGTQYRSGIYCFEWAQQEAAEASRAHYQQRLEAVGGARITTEILPAAEFYYAEAYHQQYLHKNPGGYCGLGGTGVSFAS